MAQKSHTMDSSPIDVGVMRDERTIYDRCLGRPELLFDFDDWMLLALFLYYPNY